MNNQTTDQVNREKNDIYTFTITNAVLKKHKLVLKKSLGQNFLVDGTILHKIVAAAELDETMGVLEIGPGIGALTEQLARRVRTVAAVEIDGRLFPVLRETLSDYSNIQLIHGDILKVDYEQLWATAFAGIEKVCVVANLPYYVTTPIIMNLLEAKLPLTSIVVMIQKEVAERMCAKPGGKEYGSLSLAVQYFCEPSLVTIVPRTVFVPQPNVDSAVIQLRVRREPPVQVEDEDFLFEVIRASFVQRRKTIWNNLLSKYFQKDQRSNLESVLQECGIDPMRRGETLSLEEYAVLSRSIRAELSKIHALEI